MPRNLIFLKA